MCIMLVNGSPSSRIEAKPSGKAAFRRCHEGYHTGNLVNGSTTPHGNLVGHVFDLFGWHVVYHLRPHHGWSQGIDGDTTFGIFLANRLGQSNHSCLACRIRQHPCIIVYKQQARSKKQEAKHIKLWVNEWAIVVIEDANATTAHTCISFFARDGSNVDNSAIILSFHIR